MRTFDPDAKRLWDKTVFPTFDTIREYRIHRDTCVNFYYFYNTKKGQKVFGGVIPVPPHKQTECCPGCMLRKWIDCKNGVLCGDEDPK